MSTFVLVHGAWHGGWCWSRVASILRARGHAVTTPTQTGVGEKSHLLSADITLSTFGKDIVNHLHFEELTDVILVGHSFGGCALSYTAERLTDRIQRLIYLDAAVIEGGETSLSSKPADVAALRRQLAADHDGGLSLPPPPASVMGISDPDDAAWIERMMTPHPFRTMETPLEITGQPGAGLPAEYNVCTDPDYPQLANDRERARGYGWPLREIAAGHDCMVSAPEALADLLEVRSERFYKSVDLAEVENGWTVALDGKPIKTPAKRPFAAPTVAMAEAAAAEWDGQGEEIKPAAMPVTKAVEYALDRTSPEYDAVADLVSEYGGSDLICYRADAPEGLIARQAATWDPLIDWAANRYKARLITATGVMHILQPADGQAALGAAVRKHDPFELTGLYDLVALSGSLVIGLAVAEGQMTPGDGWAASRVDHIWQEDQWGVDDEAAAQAAYKAEEFAQAARLIKLARQIG